MLVSLRPSSEHILIVRAPGTRDRHGCHSISFIVQVLRASKAPGFSLPILLRPRVPRAQETNQATLPVPQEFSPSSPEFLPNFLLVIRQSSLINQMSYQF